MIRETKKHSEIEHATAVQQRRVAAGKRGYAKAVRRWVKGTLDPAGILRRLPVLSKVEQQEPAA